MPRTARERVEPKEWKGMLYFEDLYIKDCAQIQITEFSLNQKLNCHSDACIKAELDKISLEVILCWKDCEPVVVSDKKSGCILFAGVVRELEIYWERGIQMIRMDLVSGTYLLDLEKKRYSYQKRQSYRELVEEVIPDKAMLAYAAQEQEVSNLFVQYDETDWRFIDRLASQLKVCIIPEINASWGARFYFGIRNGIYRGEADSFSYREGMDSRYHSAKICHESIMKQDYIYYEITGYENYDIGDYLAFQGQLWQIGEKSARLKHRVMEFEYRLSNETYFKRDIILNPSLHGKEIQGIVKRCERELLQIALETDKDKKEQNTFFYQWMPESGNLMYCMPEPGEQAALYFCNDYENHAICINSKRKNKEFPTKQWNPSNKQFLTHGNKEMQLRKEQMEIKNLDSHISIDEKQGISVYTQKDIYIQSVERVAVRTGRLNIKAGQEIAMIKEDLFTPTMISLKADINAKGRELKTEPRMRYDDKTIPDRIFDKGKDLERESKKNDGMGMLARR